MKPDTSRTAQPSDNAPIEFSSPGRFQARNPEPATGTSPTYEPAPFQLGVTRDLHRFSTADAALAHVLALLQQARTVLSIYSPDFEPWLYHHHEVQLACTRFLLAHPGNRLRVLLGDSSRATKEGHRLLNLSRRLSSNFHIRRLNPEAPGEGTAFLLADQHGLLLRPEPARYDGYALYHAPDRVRQQQQRFDSAWDISVNDPNLRSFLL